MKPSVSCQIEECQWANWLTTHYIIDMVLELTRQKHYVTVYISISDIPEMGNWNVRLFRFEVGTKQMGDN